MKDKNKKDQIVDINRREAERKKRRDEAKRKSSANGVTDFKFNDDSNNALNRNPYTSKEDFNFSNHDKKRIDSQKGNPNDKLEEHALGSTKHNRKKALDNAKDMLNDGKDIANAMTQKNTLKDVNELKNGLKKVNPFSLKSIKDGLDNTVNQSAKMGLDKTAVGAGTFAEKVSKYIPFMKKTKDGKIDYANSSSKFKIILWAVAIAVFILFWVVIISIILAVVVLGASYFAVTDNNTISDGSDKPKVEESTKDTNNKSTGSVNTPAHLKGVVLPPVTIFANSGYGSRTINGAYEFHYGYDFQESGASKAPVYANIEGTIVGIENGVPSSAKGFYVAIYNEEKEVVVSNQHMMNPSANGIKLNVGDKVKIDTIIGYQGNTGNRGAGYYPFHVHIDTMINMKPTMVKNFNILSYYNKAGNVVAPDSLINCGSGDKPPSKPNVGHKISSCYNYGKKIRKLK